MYHCEYYHVDVMELTSLKVEAYIFRIHSYLFLPDDGNYIAERLREGQGTFRLPIELPNSVKIGSFEKLLDLLYRK